MIQILTSSVNNMIYIDITNALSIEDYYKTDLHWKQENLGNVIDVLSKEMNFQTKINLDNYTKNVKEPFYGVYYGQSALNIKPDRMIYLTNEAMKDITVFYFDTNEFGEIYQKEKFSGIDPYNLFLSGPAAVIVMENKNAKNDKELVLFRDSFGSSLAPLLRGICQNNAGRLEIHRLKLSRQGRGIYQSGHTDYAEHSNHQQLHASLISLY